MSIPLFQHESVVAHHWLTHHEFMAGLALLSLAVFYWLLRQLKQKAAGSLLTARMVFLFILRSTTISMYFMTSCWSDRGRSSIVFISSIAGLIAGYYEQDGLRPMLIGHSLGGMQVVKDIFFVFRFSRIEPAFDRVIVMGPGIDNTVLWKIIRYIIVFFTGIKSELEDFHPGKTK